MRNLASLDSLIQPGGVISASEIVIALGIEVVGYDTREWDFNRLQVRQYVETKFAEKFGYRTFVENANEGLRIITPQETASAVNKTVAQSIRRMRKANDICTTTADNANISEGDRVRLRDQGQNIANMTSVTRNRSWRDAFRRIPSTSKD